MRRKVAKLTAAQGWRFQRLGLTKEAAHLLERASKLYREVFGKNSGPKAELELADLRRYQAVVLIIAGRRGEALEAATDAARIRRKQASLNPDDVDLLVAYAEALTELCSYQTAVGRIMEAEESGQRALSILSGLVQAEKGGPMIFRHLGDTWAVLASAMEGKQRRADALQRYRESKKSYQEWISSAHPGFDGVSRLGEILNKIAAVQWILGQEKESTPPILAQLKTFESDIGPELSVEMQKDRGWATLAEAQIIAGDLQDSRRSFEQSRDIYRRLLGVRKDSSLVLYWYALRTLQVSEVLDQLGDAAAAFRFAEEARAIANRANKIDPEDKDISILQIFAENAVATAASKLRDSATAAKAIISSRSLLKQAARTTGQTFRPVIFQNMIAAEWEVAMIDGNIERFQQSTTEWAKWIDGDGTKLMGRAAQVLRLGMLLWERQMRLRYVNDAGGLEETGKEIISQAERLFRVGSFLDGLPEIASNAALLAAAGRLAKGYDENDSQAAEYMKRFERYSKISPNSPDHWQENPQYLTGTLVARLRSAMLKGPAAGEREVEQEFQRWDAIWRQRGPTEDVRHGLALCLLMKSGLETSVPAMLRHLSRAETVLQPLRGSGMSSPMSWLVFSASFRTAELYDESKQQEKAIAKLEEMLNWVEGRSVTGAMFRGMVLSELAIFQMERTSNDFLHGKRTRLASARIGPMIEREAASFRKLRRAAHG